MYSLNLGYRRESKMKIDTKIKGWNFLKKDEPEGHHSLDGSSSLDELQDELSKLEDRLVAIPSMITKKQNAATLKDNDAAYLLGLGWLKRRKWEKQNGKTVEQAAKQLKTEAEELRAEVSSLKTEKDRLPDRIETLQKQINTLINAESKGMEKGIDSDSAKQLGEIEVAKQQEALKHQQLMMQKQAQEAENSKEEKRGSQTQWFVIAGVGLLLIVAAFFVIKKLKAKPKVVTA